MKTLHLAIIFSLLMVFVFSQTALAQTSPQNIMQNDNTPMTKLSSNGTVLIINQTIDKFQFEMGEPIVVHPEMSNVGNNQVFVANGLPLFHVEVRSENGTTVFDSGYSGMLIVGWGFTLGPGMTESDNGTWGSWPKAGAPVIHINTPGKYEILSEANISLYPSSHDFYYNPGHSLLLQLWSMPLEISVLPEKYEPPQLPKSKVLPNQTAVVEIENGTSVIECKTRPCFNPDKLVIKVGTLVTWINHDIYGHTVTSGMQNDTVIGTNFDSGVIRPGESFNQTFSKQGNFSYFDEVRPWITGEIIVSNTSQYSHLPTNYTSQINSSPLKQFKSGVTTQNITCKEGFVLAIKKQGHQPACVSPDTIPKLVLRGWSENPLNDLLLKYGNQTQANLVFYDIMNEPKIRDWSMKGWRYSDYSYASNGETHQFSATIHLYLPSNTGKHTECENGSYGIVVINLNPVEIEHNYTEVGCDIVTTTATKMDPESIDDRD